MPDKYSFLDDRLVSGAGNEQSKQKERKRKKREKKKEAKNEEMMTVHCTNGHGQAEIPKRFWYAYYCGDCEEPSNAEGLIPYYPTRGVA